MNSRQVRHLLVLATLLLCLAAPAIVCATEVELRLVPFDQPDSTVDKLEKSRPLANPVSTSHGMVMERVGVETVTWARNVLLDGKPIFERYIDGKYIDRLPIARAELKPGDHVIWPGNHTFSLAADGSITAKSPELMVAGAVVKVRCYPVTLRAFQANPEEGDLPMSMRVSALPNVTIRESADADAVASAKPGEKKPLELLPVFDKFSPLTLWMPGSTVGKGYTIVPVGLTFHLTNDGIKAAVAGGQSVADLRIEKNLIDIPLYAYHIHGAEGGNRLIVPGVEQYVISAERLDLISNWYPRAQPYILQLDEFSPTISIDGDLRKLPYKAIAVDFSDRTAGSQRLLVVETDSHHLTPGKTFRSRIRALDTLPVTLTANTWKSAKKAMEQAIQQLAVATKKKGDAEGALKANQTQSAQKTTELTKPDLSDEAKKTIQADVDALKIKADELASAIPPVTAEIDKLNATIDQLKPVVAEAQAKLDAVRQTNPVVEAPAFAQIRSYDGGDWRDVSIQPTTEPREYELAAPDIADGIYRLRIGIKPADELSRPLWVESWVTLATARPYGIGLFTERGRDSFYRGEGFWVGLGIQAVNGPVAPGTPVVIELVDSTGHRFPIFQETNSQAINQRKTTIVRIDPETSLRLAPGRYRVEAKVGAVTARPFAIDFVNPEPVTHFTNLLNMKYNSLGQGGDYQRVVQSSEGAEQLAQWISDLGYNAVMGMNSMVERVVRRDAEIEQLARERPELGPWESYYQPSGRDKFMSALLRRNIRFYEDIFTYNDTMMPRDPHILDACERYIALETAAMRHNPVFKGVCLYDEFYNSGDSGTSIPVIAAHYAAQEMSYRSRYEKEGYTSARALKALDRFTGRPFGQRDYKDLAMFRTWPGEEDYEWRTFSQRMSGQVRRIMPEAFNFTLDRYFGENGGNISVNGTPTDVFTDLNAAVTVMYKDGGAGDRPVFAPLAANTLRGVRDDLPVWTQLHDFNTSGIFGMHILRQAFFALSQKIEGFSYFTLNADPHAPSPFDHRQTFKNLIGGITNPYGDFLMSLDKGYTQVGIYYSRQADYLNSRKPNSIPKMCEGLWVACMRAGFPAQFIYDDQLLAGKGDRFKVIFIPGIAFEDETPPEILKQIQKLVDSGKTVIVEKSSKLPIEGIVHADSEFDEFDDKLGGAFPRYVDFEFDAVIDGSEETTKLLRTLLPKYVPPATESSMLFSPDWLRKGEGQYLIASNFAPTKFSGLYKTLYQAPDVPTIRFPKRNVAAVYDVLEMKPVAVKSDGDWMSLDADLRDYPGKIFAFLPAAIDKVALQATAKISGGQNLDYAVSVVDARGQIINGSFPVDVTLTDSAGQVALHVSRAAAPEFRGVFPVPSNAPAGTWKLRVRELISGCVSESPIVIDSGNAIAGQVDVHAVWVRDSAHIKQFVSDKTPATIVVDLDQAWVLPQAKRLAEALTRAGKPTKVVSANDVLHLPVDWKSALPVLDGSRLWRGDVVQPGMSVEGPLILLGRRLESRLIEGIVRRDALTENISANFPGTGRAVVAWVPLAFNNHADTVMVLAQDEASLARGVDQLLSVNESTETPIRQMVWPRPDAKATLVAGTQSLAAPTSFRRSATMLDPVRTVDVDPATGRSLVGTFGYGNNLFCFDSAGKLIWKRFLPEHDVYFARWYDGGKRILAATSRGPWMFIIDPDDGKVVRKFLASEWPDGHGYQGFWEGAESTQLQIEINAVQSQIIIAGRTGLLAVDFDGKKLWFRDRAPGITAYPATAEQSAAAIFNASLKLGSFTLSPDGTKIAHGESLIVGSTPDPVRLGAVLDLWAYRPMILDARSGAVIATNESDPGSERGWSISWPSDSRDPLVRFQFGTKPAVVAPLMSDGKLGAFRVHPSGLPLSDGRTLALSPNSAAIVDFHGRTTWNVSGEQLFPTELDRLSLDKSRLFRCSVEGLIHCIDLSTGKSIWTYKAPFNGIPAPLPDGGVIIGTTNGLVLRLDATGKLLWSGTLLDLNERPSHDYGSYILTALRRDVDATGELYPISHDSAGDYEKVFRMGIEQLKNGSFESIDGWTSADGPIKTEGPAKEGALSLSLLPNQLITQRLAQRIIPQGTYLLEFWYVCPDATTKVTAGTMLTSENGKQILTASKFSGRPGEWTFGRLAVKALGDTKTIDVGFQSEGGIARIDLASFRAIRFPSANLLANAELQAIEPTFVRDIRVQYDRIPAAVHEHLMSRNHVAVFRQGPSNTATIFAQEQAYLQNGRIDDVGTFWSEPPDPMGFSAALTKPSWISHAVLYLNNATPGNTYRFISILANDLQSKVPHQVALVRGNDRRFVVVKFDPPIFTDSIKILPGFHGGHKECLTELELYGPLGGPEQRVAGFTQEAGAYPMFMGAPSHVPATQPADLVGNFEKVNRMDVPVAYFSNPIASDDLFIFADASGLINSIRLPLPTHPKPEFKTGPAWKLASVAPISTPAHFGGQILVGSADNQVHAVSDQGTYLWGFKTGGRVYSSPLPNGDDLYFGSDDGRLYKVDIHSGMMLWEFVTADRIRSSPAMANGKIYFASWDGFLYAVDAESGQLAWKLALARFTRASPAVANGRLYIGDESGQMLCFDANSGSPIWKSSLGGYISSCPVVTSEGILFNSEQGDVALLKADDGVAIWKQSLGGSIGGALFATKTQVLVPASEGLVILRRADGQRDPSVQGFAPGAVSGAIVYQGKVGLTRPNIGTNFSLPPRTYGTYESSVEVWATLIAKLK